MSVLAKASLIHQVFLVKYIQLLGDIYYSFYILV